jgi:hypothetical protein
MPSVVVQKFEQVFRVNGRTDPVLPVPAAALGPLPNDKDKMDWLYGALTILDTKAGALLAFDGLLLAAEALMYETFDKIPWLRPYSLPLIFLTLVAALVCLFVAYISYAFLGKVTLGVYDNTAEIQKLAGAVELRTVKLWVGWSLSLLSVFYFIFMIFAVWVSKG